MSIAQFLTVRTGKDAWRFVVRRPWVASVLILTVCISVAGALLVFGTARDVFLNPLPFPQANRLRLIHLSDKGGMHAAPMIDLLTVRDLNRSYESLAMYSPAAASWGWFLTDKRPYRVVAYYVSHKFFSTLRPRWIAGTGFETSFADQSVIISERLWRNYFDANPNLVGQTIHVNKIAWRVRGVVSDRTRFPFDAEVWFYLPEQASWAADVRNRSYFGIGQLRSGVTDTMASQDLQRISRITKRSTPTPAKTRAFLLKTL